MKWWNLKNNKCPKCNKDFVMGLTVVGDLYAHECGFKIRKQRYEEIVNDMLNKQFVKPEGDELQDYWE